MLAALLGALFLFNAVPAQAQTTVWSSTLTVQRFFSNAFAGCHVSNSPNCAQALTPEGFSFGGRDYTVRHLYVQTNPKLIQFGLNPPVMSGEHKVAFRKMTLRLGNTDFQLNSFVANDSQASGTAWVGSVANGAVSSAEIDKLFAEWQAGTQVSVRLIGPPPPPPFEFNLSASPDPVPWDGAGAITVELSPPGLVEDVSVEITNRGLCVWDSPFNNTVTVNVPDGSSEKKVRFNVAPNEDYYNGEGCYEENKEDCKKCFFIWTAWWTTGGEQMTSRDIIVLPILPPSGTRTPTSQPPPGPSTGGGPPTGGGSSPGGGSPPAVPSDPTPDSPRCGKSDREYLVSFYRATGGDTWHRNENWNSEEPLDQWFRVEADEDENVVSLRLADNNLSEDMPEELLSCLSELKELALWDNEDLLGDVPEELVLAVERAALRDIADMLDLNPEWFYDYEDPFDFEDWHEGVTTDDEGRVTELDLPGEIPENIRSQFKKLTEIMITTSDRGCAVGASSARVGASGLLAAVFVMLLALSRELRARRD